jgi:hypothetical protein
MDELMPFRSSPYIDFNSGKVIRQPMELIGPAGPRAHQPLPTMLTIFECRVDVWTFGPAVEMLTLMESRADDSVWAHSGYTLLASTFSYFEMVGKILNPKSKVRDTSSVDFNTGFCDVYPAFAPTTDDRRDKAVRRAAQFRNRVRNGLYHLGFTKSHLYIHRDPTRRDDFMTEMQKGELYYFVNPHNMTRTIVDHFPTLMNRLRDPAPKFDALRTQFKEFYVKFHHVASPVVP